MENKQYELYRHYEDDMEFECEFDSLEEALDYCHSCELARYDIGHAIHIENDKGNIFEINYCGHTWIDNDKVITEKEYEIIEEYMGW